MPIDNLPTKLIMRPPYAYAGHEDSAAICSLPMQAGDCRGIIPRYFFNTEASKCSEFNYSGCGGNGNNFETLHDCENMCAANKGESREWEFYELKFHHDRPDHQYRRSRCLFSFKNRPYCNFKL